MKRISISISIYIIYISVCVCVCLFVCLLSSFLQIFKGNDCFVHTRLPALGRLARAGRLERWRLCCRFRV